MRERERVDTCVPVVRSNRLLNDECVLSLEPVLAQQILCSFRAIHRHDHAVFSRDQADLFDGFIDKIPSNVTQ